MTHPTETEAGSDMPSASTFAIHNRAMTHKPDMETVLRRTIDELRATDAELRARVAQLEGWLTNANQDRAEQRALAETYREALRPFAEAYRAVKAKGIAEPWFTRHGLAWQDFARAAELIPDTKKGE